MYNGLVGVSGRFHDLDRLTREQLQQVRQFGLHFTAVDHAVDSAFFQQEFGALEAFRAYVDLAKANGLDPAQLALKFCDARPFVTATIIGATSMAQLKTDIDAFDLNWTDELETAVNAIHARHPNPCP